MKIFLILFLMIGFMAADMTLVAKDEKKKPANELPGFSGGVVYALPRTGIRIQVEVEQEKFYRGPYSSYAQQYLGIKNASTTDMENWTITSISMETYGEPDPAAVYKAFGPVASLLSLSEEGVLVGINCEVKTEIQKSITNNFPVKELYPENPWKDVSMHSYLSEKDSTKRAGINFKSLEEKAAEAADDILKFRKKMAMTLAAKSDKLPPDGKAYQVMVDELGNIIENYVALFAGKSIKKSYHFSFEVVPDAKSNRGLVAFRFSPTAGVLPESNVSGKPVMLEIEQNSELQQKVTSIGNSQANGETSTNGVNYRIPGIVVAKLLNGSDILAQKKFSAAQYGVVAPLPDGLLNGDYSIELYPSTGAIRKITTF